MLLEMPQSYQCPPVFARHVSPPPHFPHRMKFFFGPPCPHFQLLIVPQNAEPSESRSRPSSTQSITSSLTSVTTTPGTMSSPSNAGSQASSARGAWPAPNAGHVPSCDRDRNHPVRSKLLVFFQWVEDSTAKKNIFLLLLSLVIP